MADAASPAPLNTQLLTKEFCTTVKQRLWFMPADEKEAAYIMQRFFDMGFVWYHGKNKDLQRLGEAVRGKLYFDTDRTLMLAEGRSSLPTDGFLCSSADFTQAPLSSAPQLLTPADAAGKTLLFFPKTAQEATALQKNIVLVLNADLGLPPHAYYAAPALVEKGVALRGGRLYLGPTPEDLRTGIICSVQQLGHVESNPFTTSAEHLAMRAVFNEMTARLHRLQAEVDTIRAEVCPQEIQKPYPGLRLNPPGKMS